MIAGFTLNPIEALKDLIKEILHDFANVTFGWLKIFMLQPTDFQKFIFASQMREWIFAISISIAIMFLVANLMRLLIQRMGGYAQRGPSEIVVKSISGVLLSILSPFILELFIKINNAWVDFVIGRGINVDSLAKSVNLPAEAGISICITSLFLLILYLVLAIQYLIRSGELLVLLLFAPIAAITHANEDMNIWGMWWRESIAVVFQQAFQITILWVMFNQLVGEKNLEGCIVAIGLVFVLLKGPSFLRKFIYSSGAGRAVVSAAGGIGRMAIYKYAARKVVAR